jgi:hypothetical protein
MGKLHTRRTEEEETKLPLERNWTKISTETAHEITPPGSKPPDLKSPERRLLFLVDFAALGVVGFAWVFIQVLR